MIGNIIVKLQTIWIVIAIVFWVFVLTILLKLFGFRWPEEAEDDYIRSQADFDAWKAEQKRKGPYKN